MGVDLSGCGGKINKKCDLCGNSYEYFMLLNDQFICMKCYENLSEKEKSKYSIGKKVIVPSGLSDKEIADFIVENI